MSQPTMLDLFAGKGGAGEGYIRAGWDVTGVDIADHGKHYPGKFIQGDAIAYLTAHGREYDAIHASPPCQGYTIATAGNPKAREKYQRLIPAVRELLTGIGGLWVIENVEQARSQMINPVLLCGRMFGLKADDEDGMPLVLDRHRLFESSVPLTVPDHPKHGDEQVAGVYGGSRRAKRNCPRNEKGQIICRRLPCDHETYATLAPRDRHAARVERGGGYVPRSKRVKEELLGIDWMTIKGMEESIPPAYSQFIGEQFLNLLSRN